jgi:hypothetical protein
MLAIFLLEIVIDGMGDVAAAHTGKEMMPRLMARGGELGRQIDWTNEVSAHGEKGGPIVVTQTLGLS